jgi:hypothetical protein
MQHTRRDCKKKKGPICGKRLRRDNFLQMQTFLQVKHRKVTKKTPNELS